MSDNNDSNVSEQTLSSPPPTWLNELLAYIDDHQAVYIDRLRDAVAIPSISSNLSQHLPDIEKMMHWTAQQHIERLGGTYELRTNPRNTESQPLPPILLASFPGGDDDAAAAAETDPTVSTSALKTVCVYGHLDVQPASMEDGWDTDPFVLTERDGKLYGRGSTDDKGPALSWLWIIEAYQALKIPLPVNIKIIYEYVRSFLCVCCVADCWMLLVVTFCILLVALELTLCHRSISVTVLRGMEEYGSDGMDELIRMEAQPGKFLSDVDFFCISVSSFLSELY